MKSSTFVFWGVFAAAVLASFLLPKWLIFILALALSRGLAALSVVVLIHLGLVSFGQALFFALSAYVVGTLMKYLGWNEIVSSMLAGITMSFVLAVFLGPLLARYRAIFFAMLTMAFSMVLYGLLVKAYDITSGTDGLPILKPTFLGFQIPSEYQNQILFLVTLSIVFGLGYVIQRYFNSPIGKLSLAIKSNEIRVEYLGLSPNKVVYTAYIISAVLAGAGGVLTAFITGHIEPNMAYWSTSGEFVIVAVLGGSGSVIAPISGAILFEFLRTYAYKYAPYTWQIFLGGILLIIILLQPNGLWDAVERFIKGRVDKWKPSSKPLD